MSCRLATVHLLLVACVSGCSILPHKQPPPVTYDLGSTAASGPRATGRTVAVQSVSAPVWLDSNAIEYRLAYQDEFRRQSYRDSRWVAPPHVLMQQRFAERIIQQRGAQGSEAPYLLRIELDEFVQIFDSPTSSHVKIQVRAFVQSPKLPGSTREQTFTVERQASTPDSAGAIRALAAAADEIVVHTLVWAETP